MAFENNDLRLISFYLPQFHPIPENDRWWGKGFTEWRNVVKARPLFRGHYQPHLPADLGYYDLRLPEAREAQAELAKQYGIYGFCYYHYWFNGRRLLERPFNDVLSSGRPDLPFCLCWANEKWTRGWDGREREILIDQIYSLDDDRAHIRNLMPAFRDSRYIRIDGRPLFLVYRTEDLPHPEQTASIWREESRRAGIGDIYLARVESFVTAIDPASIGFDAAVEFAPDWRNMGDFKNPGLPQKTLLKLGLLPNGYSELQLADYTFMSQQMLHKPWPDYSFFRCVTPGFDNSARRREGGATFMNATPENYERWLRRVVEMTRQKYSDDRRLVFVNAWNEWAEGNHLEPDQKFGHAFLEATARGVGAVQSQSLPLLEAPLSKTTPHWKRVYWRGRRALNFVSELVRQATFKSQ